MREYTIVASWGMNEWDTKPLLCGNMVKLDHACWWDDNEMSFDINEFWPWRWHRACYLSIKYYHAPNNIPSLADGWSFLFLWNPNAVLRIGNESWTIKWGRPTDAGTGGLKITFSKLRFLLIVQLTPRRRTFFYICMAWNKLLCEDCKMAVSFQVSLESSD